MAKLLLVEDDNNLREIYQARLSAEGYEIVAAQNGEEALSVAKQARPDLIISDVMMPRISGFEMLDILRATPELASTKVIMLTALGQAEDQARAGKLGADKYLVKSQVTLEDIVNCAKDLLDGTTVVTPEAAQPATPADVPATATTPVSPVPSVPLASTTDSTSQEPATAPSPVETPQPDPVPAPTPPADPTAAGISTQAVDNGLPVSSPADPIAPVLTSVADPDPITAPVANATPQLDSDNDLPPIVRHGSSMVQENEPSAEVNPVEASLPQPTSLFDASTKTTPEQNIVPQSLASEGAAIESQIAAFANSQNPTTTPQDKSVPASASDATATLNEQTLNEAVQGLADAVNEPPVEALPPSQKPLPVDAVVNQQQSPSATPDIPPTAQVVTPVASSPQPLGITVPESSVSVPSETTAAKETTGPTPQGEQAAENDQVNVAGKKVIQPINDITHGPNLNELLAKEVEKEQANTDLRGAVVGEEPQPAAPAAPATPINPVATATAPTQTIDPNSIAL